jgi:methionyl-tRNA synthetase
MKKLLITSALPYANGSIHLGHLVEYVQTDIWARYWRLRGRDVAYVCADDTHGTPIMMRAKAEGIAPEQLIERVAKEHARDFAAFDVHFDNYYSTHSPENRAFSSEIYLALKAAGHIDERDIEQAYCPSCQMFLPDRFIKGTCPRCRAEDQYGDSCEACAATYGSRDLVEPYCAECGAAPVWRTSRHLFFRLADFAAPLQAWLRGGHVQDEVANKLQEWFVTGLQDWDISRDAPYFGFEIPGQVGKYFYVWLDAPVGYMASTLDWCRRVGRDVDDYWRRDDAEVFHFIGKDIIYFHALFWPAMLLGSGFRTPTGLCVHGFLTVNGQKMSKSRGTFVTAETYVQHLDPQYLRYYFASKLSPRVEDIDLALDDFVNRVNSDLVGKFANIPSRVLAFVHSTLGGRLGRLDAEGRALVAGVRGQADRVAELYEQRQFGEVARLLGEQCGEINRYLQDVKPWTLKGDDLAQASAACTAALNAFRVVATYLAPILPRFAEATARMLGTPALDWSNLDLVLEDTPVATYERLAQRLERKQVDAMIAASAVSVPSDDAVEVPPLSLDALVDCAFAPMTVTAAVPLTDTTKLVELTLDEGGRERKVLAGIGHAAALPESGLLGRQVLVLANLEPKVIRGHESRGMVLAAEVDGAAVPCKLTREA